MGVRRIELIHVPMRPGEYGSFYFYFQFVFVRQVGVEINC